MPGPIVEVGDDITLRTVEREDAGFVQRFYTDPWARVGVHASSHKNQAEVAEAIEEEFEDNANAAYLICVDDEDAPYSHPDEDDTKPVGFVLATHVDRDRPEIVHWVASEYRGEGYAMAGLELAIETIFRTYDVHSVSASPVDGDDATRERLEALGFVHEGANRETEFVAGEYRDVHQYGLLRREREA